MQRNSCHLIFEIRIAVLQSVSEWQHNKEDWSGKKRQLVAIATSLEGLQNDIPG